MKIFWYGFSLLIFFVQTVVCANSRGDAIGGISEQAALFQEMLLSKDAHGVNKAYKELETYFFSYSSHISPVDWSTFLELTKNYSLFCVRNGHPEDAVQVVNSLIVKGIPEIFIPDLMFILQFLNPGKESLETMASKLRHMLDTNPYRVFSFENNLLVNAYETLVQDCLWNVYQEISANFYLKDYSNMALLCSGAINKIQGGEIIVPKQIQEGVLLDLARLQAKAAIYSIREPSSESLLCEKIKTLSDYLKKSLDHFRWDSDFLDRLQREKIRRDLSIDMMLVKSGRRLFQIEPEKGISVLESAIHFGTCIRNAPTRDALACLLDIYFIRKNQEDLRRLIKLTEDSFGMGDSLFRDIHFYKGWLFYNQGDFLNAIREFKQSLNQSETVGKQDPLALLFLGEIFLRYALEHFKTGEDTYIYLVEAEKYFLLSYKNWGREEGALGYFISALLQQQTSFSDSLIGPMNFLREHFVFLSPRGQRICRSFVEIFSPELKNCLVEGDSFFKRETDLYGLIYDYREGIANIQAVEKGILKFILQESFNNEDDIANLFQDIISWKLSLELGEFSKTCSPNVPWSFLHRIMNKNMAREDVQIEIVNSKDISPNFQRALRVYIALKFPHLDLLACDDIESWTDGCELLRYVLANLGDVLMTPFKHLYSEPVEYKKFGEEFYFKLYPISRYLKASDLVARDHLRRFTEVFPHSDLAPVVFFLLGLGEEEKYLSLEYLKSSVRAFDLLSTELMGNRSYAYFYIQSCLEYAGKLLETRSMEDGYEAIRVLEQLKIKSNHPELTELGTMFLKKHERRIFIRYLIMGYLRIFEEECLLDHIFEHLEQITLDTNFSVWVLVLLEQLKAGKAIN